MTIETDPKTYWLFFFFLKEEIRKLYGQLQQMKTVNMEAGNRHLGRSSSLLFGGSTPSLLSSTPNNNGSKACLVTSARAKRPQRYSPAAELASDFVWRRFLKQCSGSIALQTSEITNHLNIFSILHFCIVVFLIFTNDVFLRSSIAPKEWSKTSR